MPISARGPFHPQILRRSHNEVSEYDPNWEQDREPQQNRITTMPPLMEQLHEQLILSDLAGTDVEIAEFIIGNIDDRGYLTCSAEEVSEALGSPLEDVERNLKVIQGFDPLGVGARGLQECLSIQLTLRDEPGRDVALRVIRYHWDDLTKRRYSRITKGLAITNDDLKAAVEVIEKLQPNPGITASTSDYSGLLTLDMDVSYVTPDLIVERAGEDWVVSLTDGTLPSVRVNSAYAKLLRDGARSKDEIRTYVSKKLGDARWLINAINQRRATMLKVANYIVRAQMDWFERGPAHLRPMVLQDVADVVEMHVSTISRVSNGKYILGKGNGGRRHQRERRGPAEGKG